MSSTFIYSVVMFLFLFFVFWGGGIKIQGLLASHNSISLCSSGDGFVLEAFLLYIFGKVRTNFN